MSATSILKGLLSIIGGGPVKETPCAIGYIGTTVSAKPQPVSSSITITHPLTEDDIDRMAHRMALQIRGERPRPSRPVVGTVLQSNDDGSVTVAIDAGVSCIGDTTYYSPGGIYRLPGNSGKSRCSYCGGQTEDDYLGNCAACGAPRS